jgi:peroxiredoxin Q/BCP
MRGKKVVLFFYPKDMTPGCTLEGKDFSAMKGDFEAAGAVVFGISRDPIKSHKKFIEKECLTIDLLSDETGLACNLFAVMKEKNMYGKMVLGIERSTFLIDAQGVLRREWRGVKVEGHAAEVLEAVRSLS